MLSHALSLALLASTASADLSLESLLGRADTLVSSLNDSDLPSRAQVINQLDFAVLDNVEPATIKNGSSVFMPTGSAESLLDRPFHVYDKAFLDIIGLNPTFQLIAEDPTLLFHEAAVWIRETDEIFFAQNAGAPASGSGLNKSNVISKIDLKEIATLANETLANVTTVPIDLPLEMTNGGTNYKGQMVFANQGRGADIPANLAVVNPYPPYNSTIILNNFFGRQFNSLNDIKVHPRNTDIYFTDTTYGYLQDFKPLPGLPEHIYRFNPCTGAVTVVADGFGRANGLAFSPNGDKAYLADTGAGAGFYASNWTRPATVYSFDVQENGTFENRKVFAFADAGLPDGVHVDTAGNVYIGVGDGISVWSPSGVLLGKIYHGSTTANFAFAGNRIFVMAEDKAYLATIAAEGQSYEYEYAC